MSSFYDREKMKRIRKLACNVFFFDLRSMGICRIAVALCLIADLVVRASQLEAHYTDFGILPRSALLELSWREWFISIHMLSGNYYIQCVIFAVSAFFAVSLLLGYRTRLSTVISWLLLISLHNRNPMILQGGDVLLRMLLLWGIFLPWGCRFSIDSYRSTTFAIKNNSIFSIAAFAFTLQIALMYICSAILKSSPEWTSEYTAVYYALSLDQFRIFLGHYIYGYPDLLKIITFSTYWIELLVPLLFFSPIKTGTMRMTAVIIFILFQSGLFLTMRLGLFPLISMASLLILIPEGFWKRYPVISDLFERLFRYVHSSGLFVARSASGGSTGSVNYSAVRKASNMTVIILLLFVIYWNGAVTSNRLSLHHNTVWLGHLLRIDQRWDMFAPAPFRDGGWYVIPGKLRNGESVDVFRNMSDVRWEKPDDPFRDYRTYRWRKYMRNIWLRKNSKHRLYYGRYLCRKWNRENEYNKNLMTFDIYYMKETTLPGYSKEDPEKVHLWEHRCF